MKKTLVALAALAATGAFAQAKITGELAYGFQSTTNTYTIATTAPYAATADGNLSGWGVDTSFIQVDASEDLGGGMSIAGTLGIQNIVRNSTLKGLNSQLTLTTGVGAFYGGHIRSSDFVKNFSNVGGTWYSLDGAVTPARSQSDVVGFSTKLGAIGFNMQHSEPDTKAEFGKGAEGSSAQRNNAYTLTYSAGALNAGFGVVQYDNQGGAAYKDAARVGVNYDLGVAKIGVAFQQVNGGAAMNNGKAVVSSFGVSVPMGALALSANWQQVNASDVNNAALGLANVDGSNSGYNLEAKYNLSKQTYVIASYNNYTGRNWTTLAILGDKTTQTNLILVKDF